MPSDLREEQAVSWLRAFVGENSPGMDQSRDRIAELGFFVADAMSADDGAARFDHLRQSAGENSLKDCDIGFVGEADESERGERLSAHGIDVTEGVGGGDLTEGVGVVDDGGEEVDSLNERCVGVELIHSGVVGVIEADQDVWVVLPG